MTTWTRPTFLFLTLVCFAAPSTADAEGGPVLPGPGIRGGVGMDLSGGLAFGGGFSYTKPIEHNALELSMMLYAGSSEEDSNNGFNDYHEETKLKVFVVTANYFMGYGNPSSAVFLIAGFGAGGFSVEWSEESATDTSLGIPLPGGGSRSEEDGSSGGTLFNLGIGRRVNEKFDIRLESTNFLIFSAPGEASAVVPTLTLTAALRF